MWSAIGAIMAGGVAVGVYQTSNAASCAYIAGHAGCESRA